jgi:hypothetical protein
MGLDIRFKVSCLILSFLLLFSCKKEEDRTCFKSIGKENVFEITGLNLHKVNLDSKVKYVFIQDSLNKAVIIGGENLIKHIGFDYDADSVLHIKDKNKCNFLRRLDRKITVELHVSQLDLLEIKSGDSIVSRGVVKGDAVKVIIEDGASSIQMTWDVDVLETFAKYGYADITYHGKTRMFNSNITLGTQLNALGLDVSQSVYLSSNSSQPAYVYVGTGALTGEILSNGNIYYKGTPNFVNVEEKFGKGKLVKLD